MTAAAELPANLADLTNALIAAGQVIAEKLQYAACETCAGYWTDRGPALLPEIDAAAAARGLEPVRVMVAYRQAVHTRHLRGRPLDLDVCCPLHADGFMPDGGARCCDPDDCGPCCRDCPTCLTLRRELVIA